MTKRRQKKQGAAHKKKQNAHPAATQNSRSSRRGLIILALLMVAMGWFLVDRRPELVQREEVKSDVEVKPHAVADGLTNRVADDIGSTGSATVAQVGSATGLASTNGVPSLTDQVPVTKRDRDAAKEVLHGLDPAKVGWDTEAFNDLASSTLGQLAKILQQSSGQRSTEKLDELLAVDFRCSPLVPASAQEVFRDSSISVRRSATASADSSKLALSGADGLKQAIRSLPNPVEAGDFHVKFKIISVQLENSQATTKVHAEGGGETSDGLVQWRATWMCHWSADSEGLARLLSIDVLDHEQVLTSPRGQPWLVDCTEAVLGGNESYREQLSYGMEHWLRRLDGRLGISRLGHNGIALGDVNGDGRDDIYVCQSGGLPNRLFIAGKDGKARETAESAGVDYLDDSTCALFVDLNNDGHQDLALMTISGGIVLSGDGNGKFQPRTLLAECRNAFSLTAADYDNDGRLDLYVGRYWPTTENRGDIPIPVPYYDATNGGRNLLFQNKGNWQFEDVTVQTGLDVDNTRYTMAAAWNDIDQDGDVDLYVANDFGRNYLYRNDSGKFTNVADQLGVEDAASGMSVTFADYDHDGHDDIYISNMFSSAGTRVTYQRQYAQQFESEAVQSFQRMARGNTLFRGNGAKPFEDVSVEMDVTMGRWAWGSLFADLNNDSWDDLLVLNGNITNEDSGDL